MTEVRAPLQAQIVQWLVQPGDTVQPGDVMVILEAMKMEHEVRATHAARVTELFFVAGETVTEGDLLLNQELLAHIPRGLEANFAINSSVEQQPAAGPHVGCCPP